MKMLLAFLFLGVPLLAAAAEPAKITLGAVEEVVLLPWKIRMPARVDTGATGSSLGGKEIRVEGDTAVLLLDTETGERELRLPIHKWRRYRTSEGGDRRPVVQMELCIAGQRVETEVNLNIRTGMEHPFLIGRNVLRGRFVVDVERSGASPADCEGSK